METSLRCYVASLATSDRPLDILEFKKPLSVTLATSGLLRCRVSWKRMSVLQHFCTYHGTKYERDGANALAVGLEQRLFCGPSDLSPGTYGGLRDDAIQTLASWALERNTFYHTWTWIQSPKGERLRLLSGLTKISGAWVSTENEMELDAYGFILPECRAERSSTSS
jgi:hypothetical protein